MGCKTSMAQTTTLAPNLTNSTIQGREYLKTSREVDDSELPIILPLDTPTRKRASYPPRRLPLVGAK